MTEQTSATIEQSGRDSRRFATNVSSNVAVLVLNMVVGIWFTPYLIGVLGVAVFGVATLALSISTYMGIFESALYNATGRFLIIQLREKDFAKASRTFNTALGLALTISVIMLPIMLLVSWFSPQLFNVPPGQEGPARWVFAAAVVSYMLIITRSVFTAIPFANNRLDLQNGIIASNTLIRIVATVLLLSLATVPSLTHVGAGLLFGTGASLLLAIFVMRRLTPQLNINLRQFNRAELSLLFGMSGWVFINQAGSILFLSVDQIVVNTVLGPTIQGLYASALQWSILLRSLARTFSTALAPIMIIQYAAGENRQLGNTSVFGVKLLGLLMALPVGLVAGLARPLFRVWLGPEFEELTTLLILLVLPLSVNLAVLPLYSLQVAHNRVKIPGIVSVALGILNLILAVWWVDWGSYGLGVAVASALVLTLKNVVFTPLYGAHTQGLPWYTYFPSLMISVAATISVMAAGHWLGDIIGATSWVSLGLISILIGIAYVLAAYTLALSSAERKSLLRFVTQIAR